MENYRNPNEMDSEKGGFFRYLGRGVYCLTIVPWSVDTAIRKYFEFEKQRNERISKRGRLSIRDNLGLLAGFPLGGGIAVAEGIGLMYIAGKVLGNPLFGFVPFILSQMIGSRYEKRRDAKLRNSSV